MPPEVSSEVEYSPELQRLLARSAQINSYFGEDFDISFSSLLLAFLASDDMVSQWFQAYVKKAGVDVAKILEARKLSREIMEEITAARPPALQPLRMTTSAKRYARSAEEFRQGLSEMGRAMPLDVRHLMAVFIYKPWVHERDLAGWGFEQKAWSIDFLELMRSLHPKEMGFWSELHRRVFGERAEPPPGEIEEE